MSRKRTGTAAVALVCVVWIVSGCTSGPPPRSVYQDNRTVIELRVDPQAGTGHSHPAALTREQMARILSGIRVQGDRYMAHRLIAGEAEAASAFNGDEIRVLAPQLSKALVEARPNELVTFYRRFSDSSTGLAYTSGGLFLREGHVYFILANYRQLPSDAMRQINPAYEIDPVDSPLLSLRQAGYTVSFVPNEAEVHPVKGPWTWNYPDPGKVVVVDPLIAIRGSAAVAPKTRGDRSPDR